MLQIFNNFSNFAMIPNSSGTSPLSVSNIGQLTLSDLKTRNDFGLCNFSVNCIGNCKIDTRIYNKILSKNFVIFDVS